MCPCGRDHFQVHLRLKLVVYWIYFKGGSIEQIKLTTKLDTHKFDVRWEERCQSVEGTRVI